MSHLTLEAVPTSFGNLKPVGHVLIALPDAASEEAFVAALQEAGISAEQISRITPREPVEELGEQIDKASGASGFGYEIVLMKRYLKLARQGCSWLLVKVDAAEDAQRIGELARRHEAASAVHYRTFVEEDLLP
ncbi:hypothetical protein AACH06_22755 [Ideonella sp. DXS29W]|uniref:Uncharacterized protein n=1 Tax=Ideonella lacteola TaxID=2984193 RepID=A0ABU9BUJ9_9BURK